MEVTNSLSSVSNVYPICYKIKETSYPSSCILELANYLRLKKQLVYDMHSNPSKDNKMEREYRIIHIKHANEMKQADASLLQCLKQYGDIYKRLNIDLYVDSENKITFPDNQRVQSNLNIYMKKIANTSSDKTQEETIMLYNVLLNDSLRNAYNEFYVSEGYAKNDQLLVKDTTVDKLPKPVPLVSSSNPFASKTSNTFSRKARRKQLENGNVNIITPDSSMGGKMRKTRKSKKRRKTLKRGKNKRKKIINK